MSGKFVEPIDNLHEQLKNVFTISSLLPEIKTYQTSKVSISNSHSEITNVQNNIMARIKLSNTRIRAGTCIKMTTKKKSKLPAVFMKLATKIPRPDILHSYLCHGDIMLYLDYLNARFVDFVKIHTLGLSFERRPIKCIEINWNTERNLRAQTKENRARSAPIYTAELKEFEVDDPEGGGGRNIVFIEGGTHAREWISVTVALNCIYQLTERNVRHRDLLRKLKFFIVPLVNPDGYEYARNYNPRWRKNRRPHSNGDYVGTDCNRNFDFHWEECRSKGKRNTYQGEKPFSEPETRALATILHKLAPRLLFFLSLHSYAQSIMYPWGYSKILPKNAKLMESVAMAGRNAIKSFSGRYYRIGTISQIIKRTIYGSVVDYAYGVVKIPLTLVMELPANEYGFQPPTSKINPLGNESWQGIREMCKKAYSLKSQIGEDEEMSHSQMQVKANNSVNLADNDTPIQLDSTCDEQQSESASSSESSSTRQEQLFVNDEIKLVPSIREVKIEKVIKAQLNIKPNILKKTSHRMNKGYISSILDVM